MATKGKNRARRRHVRASNPVAGAVARQHMAAQMRNLGIAIYLTPDGECNPDMLARLAWLIGLGAEVSVKLDHQSRETKRLHAALRTVLQMAVDGARWDAGQAGVIERAANQAQEISLANAALALKLAPAADVLASRIRQGTATMDDVAGAELYAGGRSRG